LRLPLQPVLIIYPAALCSSILLTQSSPQFVGCKLKIAFRKQAEKAGSGCVSARSVPANFAVKPDKKKYLVCSGVNLETGGITPKASAVKKITFFACPAFDTGFTIFSI